MAFSGVISCLYTSGLVLTFLFLFFFFFFFGEGVSNASHDDKTRFAVTIKDTHFRFLLPVSQLAVFI
jgi:hypothetical protein